MTDREIIENLRGQIERIGVEFDQAYEDMAVLKNQRDALLAACQMNRAYIESFRDKAYPQGNPTEYFAILRTHGWHPQEEFPDAFRQRFTAEAIALALPRPTESPTCTSMFEPEKGGE